MRDTDSYDAVDVLADISELTPVLIRHLLGLMRDMDRKALARLHAEGRAANREGGEQFVALWKVGSGRLRVKLRQLGFDPRSKEVERLTIIAGQAHAAVVPIADPRRRRMELRWAELLVAGQAKIDGDGGAALARAMATIYRHRAPHEVLAEIAVLQRAFLVRIIGRQGEGNSRYFADMRHEANIAASDPDGQEFSAALADGMEALRARLSLLGLDADPKGAERLAVIAGSAHAAPFVADAGRRRRMVFRWAALLAARYPEFAATAAESVVRAHARGVAAAYRARARKQLRRTETGR